MLGVDLRHEVTHRSAAAALGGAQRQPGMPLQLVAGGAVLRRLRNADAGADLPRLIEVNRRGERPQQPLAESVHKLRVIVSDDDCKSVVVETAQYRPGRQRRFEPFGDIAKHRVAAGAPQCVVEVAKTVDVDQRQGNEARAAGRQRRVEAFEDNAPVRQPGQ